MVKFGSTLELVSECREKKFGGKQEKILVNNISYFSFNILKSFFIRSLSHDLDF